MAYSHTNSKGRTYILHGKTRITSTGKEATLYYFAKEEKDLSKFRLNSSKTIFFPKVL